METGFGGNAQDDRDENRHDGRRTHDRSQNAGTDHEENKQSSLAVTPVAQDQVSDAVRNTGAIQHFTNDQKRGHHDHDRAAKSRHRLARRQYAGKDKRDHDDQGDQILPDPVAGHHRTGNRDQNEDQGGFGIHGASAQHFLRFTGVIQVAFCSKPFQT